MTPIKNKIYQLDHCRFGTAVVKIEAIDDEWAEVTVLSGNLVGLNEDWGPGDKRMVRLSHCTWKEPPS